MSGAVADQQAACRHVQAGHVLIALLATDARIRSIRSTSRRTAVLPPGRDCPSPWTKSSTTAFDDQDTRAAVTKKARPAMANGCVRRTRQTHHLCEPHALCERCV